MPGPGQYTVTVSIRDLEAVPAELWINVLPYDPQALEDWARDTTADIIANKGGNDILLTKALASIRTDVSEQYLCQVISSSSAAAIPTAVDRLAEIDSLDAVKCLAGGLSLYHGVHKEYIESVLGIVRKSTAQPDVRSYIDDVLGPPKK